MGQCADKNTVAWVDKAASNCPMADGTTVKPYCDLDAAIAKSSVKYLFVKPSAIQYTITGATNRDLTILGSGLMPGDVSLKGFVVSSGKMVLRYIFKHQPHFSKTRMGFRLAS